MNKFKECWQKCGKFLPAVIAAGVVLRIIYLVEYSGFVNFDIASGADVREYYDRALEICSGRLFPEKPDIHGIFYPLIIAPVLAVSQSAVLLRVLQTLLNAGAFAGMYFLLAQYGVSLAVRRIFLALAMLYPVLIFHTAELISESLLIPLLCIIMFLLCRMRRSPEKELLYAGFAGAFSAFCVLTHAGMLLFSFGTAAEIFREKRKKCAAVFLASLAAITGVFVLVQSLHYGKFSFVQANGGFNFYLGNSEKADGTCRLRPGLEWRKLHLAAEKEAAERRISTNRLFMEKSLRYILQNPGHAMYGFCRKAVMFFHYKELISGADPDGLVYRTKTVFAGRFFTLAVMLLAIAGMVTAWIKHLKVPPDFIVLLAAVFAVNVLAVTSGRYRIAAYPSLYLFAAYAITYIPAKVTAAFSVICMLPALLLGYGKNLDAESLRILGEAAYRKGDYDTAFRHLQQLSTENDDPSGVENMLGNIYEMRQNHAAARKCYEKVILLEPDRFEAYMNLANLTTDKNEAEKLFQKAFEKGGRQSGLWHTNYAKFLLRSGNARAAVEYAREGTALLPDNADAWNTLAVAYAYTGNIRLASEAFDAASRLVPENEGYRRNAEIMRRELQNRRKARMMHRAGR